MYLTRKQVFPTPESPMKMTFKEKSYFLNIYRLNNSIRFSIEKAKFIPLHLPYELPIDQLQIFKIWKFETLFFGSPTLLINQSMKF
jgi:hypothetical protein